MFRLSPRSAAVAASALGLALLGGCYTDGSDNRIVVANAAFDDYDVEAAIASLDAKANDRIAWLRTITEILVWTDMAYDLKTYWATPAAGQALRMINGEDNAFAYINRLDRESGTNAGLMESMLEHLVTRTCPQIAECPASVVDVLYGRRQIATAEFDEYVRRARCTFGSNGACTTTTTATGNEGNNGEGAAGGGDSGGHAM
ncbi:MAG: hypothetical protein R3F55_13415 [Alphaproteobacteria bacterium]